VQRTAEHGGAQTWGVGRALSGLAGGSRVVDREHLYAGLSAYLLAGIFFGVLYWVIERTWAGSFALPGAGGQSPWALTAAIYYSFVTLTTLGYGDIVPRSEVARGLAILEAVAGQLYLAVMIARLVSLYVLGEGKGNHSPKIQ
jgi:ion channel